MVLRGDTLKLFRCVALEEVTEEQVLAVLQPTFSYVEDELTAPVNKLILCGFRDGALSSLPGEREQLRSRFGTPGVIHGVAHVPECGSGRKLSDVQQAIRGRLVIRHVTGSYNRRKADICQNANASLMPTAEDRRLQRVGLIPRTRAEA